MLRHAELRARVADAERIWSAGDWAGAFERFESLAEEIANSRSDEPVYGFNEALVLHRFADLCVERGHLQQALDTYGRLQDHAEADEDRALAAFKRLDVAVTSGDGLLAREVRRSIAAVIGRELPPGRVHRESLAQWERTCSWGSDARAALFAQMYLALGRMANAQRRLDEAAAFFSRGIDHARASRDAAGSVAEIPLQLALGQTHLTMGDLSACSAALRSSSHLIGRHSLGSTYLLWQWIAEARVALLKGHLAETLELLRQAEAAARQARQVRAVCQCLISRAEVLVVLNLLPEAAACLSQVDHLADPDDWGVRAALLRTRFLGDARGDALGALPYSPSVGEMMTGTNRGRPAAIDDLQAVLDHAAVVWSGDCLQDYELRETAVYANLEHAPAEANRDLQNLWRDFGATGSRLIDARLHAATGLLLSRSDQPDAAAEALQRAYDQYLQIGAEREAYQAALFLARAYRDLNRPKSESLLADNDRRLERLTAGLTVEQRNAYVASKYTAAEEHQRIRIQRLLSLRAEAAPRGWQKALPLLRFWLALHAFIAGLDREQESRRQAQDSEASRPILQDGWRGLVCRLVLHAWRNLTVGYVVLPDQIFMYEIRWLWLDGRSLNVGRVAAESLHRSLAADDPASFERAAAHACVTLGVQDAFDRAPARIRALTVVADAGLHLIPFCALRHRRRDGSFEYLIERAAINFTTISAPRRRRARRAAGLAVVAHYAGTDRQLTRAEPTARAAADRLTREWRLDCRAVTEREACLAALPTATVLYYFGHGHFGGNDPDRSGIEFSGPADHNLLSLRDLDRIDLSRMEQVIVFACHGADAVAYSGRWAVGLPHMLLRRGARTVLASMWETAPEMAEDVSEGFLSRARAVGGAEALREAQLRILRGGGAADPFWWAAFQLYGDGGRP